MSSIYAHASNVKITVEKVTIYLPNAEMFRHKLPALPKQYGDEEEKKNLNVYLERFPLCEIMKM
jgi:hypothetical protein